MQMLMITGGYRWNLHGPFPSPAEGSGGAQNRCVERRPLLF